MASIYRILIYDFGSLQKQIKKKQDSILLPVMPRVGDVINYFYTEDTETEEIKSVDLSLFYHSRQRKRKTDLCCQKGEAALGRDS